MWAITRMIIAIIPAFLFCAEANAQLVVTEAASSAEVEQYVEDVLLGSCVTVSNFSYTGQAWGSGTFDGSASNLGMNSGIIMTTGRGSYAVGPDDVNDRSHNQNIGGDADLDQLLNFGFTTEDAVILEFDFVPQDDTLRFNYIFGSEEYPEYVNSGFNDVFGFFISGPGYAGPFSNGAENIALIPGTTTPVAINNINNGYSATEPAPGPGVNSTYYVENGGGATIQYDGFTTLLTALAVVVPCSTYHIKMAVADAGDHVYDSGVFLQEGSFSAGGGVSVEIETSNIPPGIYEGCNDAWFVFRRLDLLNNGDPITADFTIGGTATPGVDYTPFPTTITIPAGEDSLLVNIAALFDGIPEGTETITLTLDDPPCSCQAPETAVIDILDNDIPLAVTTTGTTTICAGQAANLTANPSGSQTPYSQSWDNGLGSGLNQTVSPTTTTTYTFTVSDACGGQTVQSSETVTVVRGDFTIDDDEQCFQGNNFSFTNTGTNDGTVTHFWDFGDGSGTSTQENPTYSYSIDGNYTVTHHVIFTAAGCTTSVSADVDVWEMPTASMASTNLACAGDDDGTATVTAADGTSPYSYAWTPGGGTTATITGLGVGTYNVLVTDDNGCTATDQAIIIHNDLIPPSAVCQNLTVQLDASGNVGISATQIDNGSSDNCGIASMVVFPNTFNCSNVGNNTVTLTVTDVNGNQSICNATVTVQDLIPPTPVCQNISVSLDALGNASITAAQIDNGSTDNCGVQSISVNPSSFDCSDVGANTVTLTVTDVNGNVSTCNATVIVIDNIPPTVNCSSITVQLDASGNATIVLADIDGGVADNCGIASHTLSQSSFDCSHVGTNVVTITVTDDSGNSTVCNATVTVEDNIPPTVNCNNINLYLDASGLGSIALVDIDGGASDNCGIASSALSPSNFNCGDVGPNNVNVTVWDVNGNTANCNSTVTVIDTVSPNALCQNITVQLDATGNASITSNDIDAGSTDNCGIDTRVLDITTFDCSDVGVNTVTLTVTDVNGNVDVCTATVNVEDNVAPSAICQNITVELDATGNASITSGDVDNGSADNCAVQSITVNPSSFTCANVGLNVVTMTVTDVNGNVSTCTSNVNVEDNISPTVICNSITVQTDVTGNVTITAADIDGGSNDNCGLAILSITPTSFDCNSLGANTVTLTAIDFSGNVSTCTATVIVEDNLPPIAICQNITAQLDPSGNVTIAAGDIDNGSTDPCGLQSITVVPSSFDCTNIGPNVVTLTVTDISGNVSTCTAVVEVVDEVIPIALCQDITVYLDATGNVVIQPEDIDNGSNDACGSVSAITVVPNTFDCNDQGGNAVTLTVEDSNGNQAICVATVTVVDPIPPTAFCQDITVQLNALGQASITPAIIDNGSFDNCAIVSYSVTPNTFNCSDLGANTVTMTVIDDAGNSSTCTATVTVEDPIAPNPICQDITVQLDANGNVSITAAQIDNGSTDNCTVQSISVTPNSFTCAAVGANLVTLTVTDQSGNVATCSATVTVQDNVNPTAICQDISVQLDATGNVTIAPSQVDNGSDDACGIASLTLNNDSFDCNNIGPNTVILTVTDVYGNVSTCTSTVTVLEDMPPTALCQNITVQLDAAGNITVAAIDVDNGSFDNCSSGGALTYSLAPNTFDCDDVGVVTATLTVTDAAGNSSSCAADITVEDNVPPIAICQDITIQLDAAGNASIVPAQIDNGSSDNCGIANMSINPNIFTCATVGGNPVTLTVVDFYGNVSTCSATVTVQDNVDPVAICQDITVQLDASGNATVTESQIDNGSNDACGIASLTINNNSFDCSDLGANTVTLTVVDVNGNTSTCTSTVTVEDNVAPTAICQDITIQLDATGNASIAAAQIDNGSNDACGILSISVSPSTFDCSNIVANAVVLTVTDNNGNVSTCNATVTVEDNVDPIAICQDITIQLDAIGNAVITSAQIDNGSNDACGILSMTVNPANFSCADVGPNTVTLTVTDNNGNVSTCTSTVTVQEVVPPTAICQDITIQLDATGNATITANDVDNGSNDECGLATMTVSPDSFTCAEEGANTVTLTVTDNNGNVSTCTATVTVENNVTPNVFCQDITVYLDAAGAASIIADDVNGGSNTACGLASLTVDPATFNCSNVGANTVTLTATDNTGNISTCNATVTVLDTISPTAICQDITVQLDANGDVTIVAADIDGGSSDNCDVASIMVNNSANESFDCGNVGTNTVTLTVTDVNGNVSTCVATVTVEDNVPPVAICQNITVQLDANGNLTIQSVDIDGGSFDNCGIASITVDGGATSTDFDCSNVGANTVTLTVADVNGNVTTCDATVTVEDNVDPTAICQGITVELDANGNVTIQSIDIDGGSFDNCGIASITVDGGSTSMNFDCSSVGANTITLTVTDVNGNVSTCDATVTVEDNVNPTAICQDIAVQLDANGVVTIQSVDIDGGSFDNCEIASITVDGGSTSMDFDCSSVGTNTITLTVTDVNGNVSTCDATVSVEDTISPTAICQDITIQLGANGNATIQSIDIDGGSNDNCGIASITVDGGSSSIIFDCSDEGVNTITLTVTDVNGNVSTCDAQVTVENNVTPNVLCQDISIYLDATGNVSIVSDDVNGGSNAACGLASLVVSQENFDCSHVGSNTVTLTATDNSGNVSNCDAIVTVLDTISPIIICQNITVQLDANGQVTIQSVDIDGGSTDNCDIASITVDGGATSTDFDCSNVGANTVTLTITDVNGNVSTCDATVTVEDNVDPTAICQDITVQLDANGNVTIQSVDIDGGSFDNCGIASITVDGGSTDMSFDCSNVGANTITLTVTDVNGNVSTCTATITVEDNVAPEVVCQDITIYLDANGDASITAEQIDAGSSSACGVANLSVNPSDFTCSGVGVNPVTLTVTNNNGNVSTCQANVTVIDTISPIAICQDLTVQLGQNGVASIDVTQIDNGSYDACGIASIAIDNDSFDCSNVGANTVTLTVVDNNGNVSTCQSTVTIEDNVPPMTLCQGMTIYLDSLGSANISAYMLDNGSNDACGVDTILINQSVYDCSELGVNVGIITVFDVNGNSSICQSGVNVQDTISPYFVNCPTDITVVPDSNNCEPIVTWIPPTGLDNCTPTVSSTHNPGDNFPVGTTTVTYTVVDQSGNSNTCSFDVTIDPVELMVSLTSPEFECGYNISCNGLDDGTIETYVSGGCLPYTYAWSDGQTAETAIDLTAGTYDVTVTDANGNQATATITLIEPDPIVITSIMPSVYAGGWNISCPGANDGSVDITVAGGADCEDYFYGWGDSLFVEVTSTEDVSGLSAGLYYIRISDVNGCGVYDSIYLTEPDSLELVFDPSIYNGDYNVSCAGSNDGSIDLNILNGTPPYSVTWDNGDLTEDISGLSAGTYVATVTDANGCEIVGEITLTEPVEISSEITSPTFNGFNISCNGMEDGSLDLSFVGGTEPYLYLWNSGGATEDLTDLGAGIYSVTITDANGCVHTDSIELIQPDELILNSFDTGLLACNGDVDGSFTVGANGGVPSYVYNWSNGATGSTALNLGAGLYTAYVLDLNGCIDSLLLQLDEPFELVAQINSQIDVSCFQGNNGLVDVGVSGGTSPYSYQWTNGETTEDLNGVPAGTYTLTVTDANFCQIQVTATVNEPTELVAAIDSIVDVTCAGMGNGQAWVSATGGMEPYSYLWSTGHQTSFVIGLSAGIHQVTITDDHGCTEVLQVEVTEPPVLFANLTHIADVGCNGSFDGSSQVEVVGGGVEPYSFQWSNGDTLSVSDSLSAGSHFVLLTDANGCDTTIHFILDEPAALNVVSALSQDPACFGDSTGLIQISITGGTEPYYPLWEDGQTTLQADGFGVGDHLVIVTDYNGCDDSLIVTLGEPTPLEIFDMVVIEPLCNGNEDGSATVIVQGGVAPYFYDWQPSGSTSASTNGLAAGDYIVVITDQHNCVLSDTVNMSQPDPVLAIAIGDTAICPGDTALVWAEATGGAGNYSYLWNQGLGIAQGAEVIPAGTTEYVVTVTDSAGCSSKPDTMMVTIAPLPAPSFTYTSPDFCAYPVQLDMENTTVGGETYEWFFGNGDFSDLQNPTANYVDPGLYTITLIAYSDIGCADTTFTTYEASEIPTASFSLDGMEGCSPVIVNFQDFSENANTYLWDFGDGTTSVLPDPYHVYDNEGDYDITLVVSTPGGCSDTMMLGAGVTVWPSPIADFNPVLFNPDSGAVYQFINLSTGSTGYEWDFSDGVSSNLEEPYHEFLANGNVEVLLIAVNEFGCIDTALHVVEIDVFTGLNVPNALAAGEVGETGLFLPKGTGLVQYRAMVFDEWGNLMWESNALENGSPAEGWDGTFKGTRVPQGAYVWKIDAEFFNGHVWEGKRYGHEKFRNTGSVSVVY